MKNHLRIFREKMGWTQEELARKVGVSRQTINYIEKGRYQPSVRL
ncbi:MAG: transcriptional regulator, partial [Thermotogae bacterium]